MSGAGNQRQPEQKMLVRPQNAAVHVRDRVKQAMLMIMAITPSLNASMRFLLIFDPDAGHHLQMPGLITSSRLTS